MSANRLDSVRDTLENELELAEAEVGRLKEELKAADAERKAIADALAALGRKKVVKSAKKPAPKKEQVLQLVASLLDTNGGTMPQEDLEGLVKSRLEELGNSLSGFGLRFGEALKHETIRVYAGNVSLNMLAKV